MKSLFFGRVFRRKARTLLFLLGFAVGVASSFALLSIGKGSVLLSLHGLSANLGDGILVPKGFQGVDLTGGNPLSLNLKDANYFFWAVKHEPWISKLVTAAAPKLENQTLYVRRDGKTLRVMASGVIPSQQALLQNSPSWKKLNFDSKKNFYSCCPDPFHKPPTKTGWMEWHYFNFLVPGKLAGYISFILYEKKAGKLEGSARFLFIKGNKKPEIFFENSRKVKLLSAVSGCRIGKSFDRFKNGRYRIYLDFPKEKIQISLFYTPYLPGLPYSNTLYHGTDFGYIQPILHGFVSGKIRIQGQKFILTKAIGYHDHNWGKMRNVTWNWGETSQKSANGYALSYGEINSGSGILLIGQRKNILAVLPIKKISILSKKGLPKTINLAVRKKSGNLFIKILLHQEIKFPGQKINFIQALGNYSVQGRLLNHSIHFHSEGFVETFERTRSNSITDESEN